MYINYIIFQIHNFFNEHEKAKFTYKCDRREYMLTSSIFKTTFI